MAEREPGAAPVPDDVPAAAARIRAHVHRTPVLTCAGLDAIAGASLHFKCESFQRAGAFKFRGASNAVLSLDDEALRHGVATHSSGNHAAALSLAARRRGTPAVVVMPKGSNPAKAAAVRHYGGEIVWCEPTQAAREETLDRVVAERGCAVVHPFDDPAVVAGQGTAALELHQQVEGLDAVVAPVGGGGLLSGTALATAAAAARAAVIGAEPRAADDTIRSLEAGRVMPGGDPVTVADGLRTTVGNLTFPIIRERVARVVPVEEEEIVAAMRLIFERMKIVVEPSAAVALAGVLRPESDLRGARVGVILSGGNVDLDALPWRR